ncbi:MAG: hypothetical protein ACYTFT_09460, partial [Planctomycetota bacterium]
RLEPFDLLVSATSSSKPLFQAREIGPLAHARQHASRPDLLLCDLGVPADCAPDIGDLAGVSLVGLADLEPVARENQARLEGEAARAEALVGSEVKRTVLGARMQHTASHSVTAFMEDRLAHLDPADAAALLRFTQKLSGRLAAMAMAKEG